MTLISIIIKKIISFKFSTKEQFVGGGGFKELKSINLSYIQKNIYKM